MMKTFIHLLRFDFKLISKYKILAISIIVTAIYVGVFKALSGFGNMEEFLILIIFNDPTLLGFLFVGVIVLFEKNENTLQALAVTPIKISHYILSKSLSLTVISLLCCYVMVIACLGFGFHFFHFTMATLFTTFIFAMLGFIAVAGQSSFNKYILRAIGIILILSLPFLGYFEIVPRVWFTLLPSQPPIDLYTFAFDKNPEMDDVFRVYFLCTFWAIGTFYWAKYTITKKVFYP